MRSRIFFSVISVLILSIPLSLAHEGAAGLIQERMDNFKQSQLHLKQVLRAAKSEEFEEVERLASLLADWGEKLPALFPESSDQKPSEASPRIWQEFADFTARANDFALASKDLRNSAGTADQKAVIKAAMRVADSCKACHSAYRQ